MNNRLYVESLPTSITETKLRALFSRFGQVVEIKLMLNASTGQPSGRAFVTMATAELAQAALKSIHGHNLDGRIVLVTEARPLEERPAGQMGQGFEAGRHNIPQANVRMGGNSKRGKGGRPPRKSGMGKHG